MTDNIATIVTRELDDKEFARGSDEAVCRCSDLTEFLLAFCPALSGVRFDDVYPNVMAWLISQDARS